MSTVKLHNNYEESSGFEPLPPAEYKCVIEKCTPRTSTNGNSMYGLQMKVVDGEHANRKVFDNIFLDEGFLAGHQFATNKLVSLIRSCGLPCGMKAGEDLVIPEPSDLVARELYVQVAVDKNDKTKNVVFHYYSQPYSMRPKKNSRGTIVKPAAQESVTRPAKDPNCPF